MKVFFLTMVWPMNPNQTNMYTDLMSEFVSNGHEVTVLSLMEARNQRNTFYAEENGMCVLRVKCGNIQKTGKYKKVISSLVANFRIINAVRKYFTEKQFDLMIFALPPSTIAPSVCLLKRRFRARLYLLLKEFWPQDPTDLKAMREGGVVWKFFDHLSKMLYNSSDYIGTMSEAGIGFLKKVTPKIDAVIESCPNCLKNDVLSEKNEKERERLFKLHDIPTDKIVCIFGGNLGVSQGIPEMVASLQNVKDFNDFCFLIVGDGTEAGVVRNSLAEQSNVLIKKWIPTDDYEALLRYADVGLIFLYPQYTVPNVPSRMVGYLKYGLPVMACVDKTTDAGKIIEDFGCGFSIINGDVEGFREKIVTFRDDGLRSQMSRRSRQLFEKLYTSECCYKTIVSHFDK